MDRGRPSQVNYPAIMHLLDDQTIYTGASIAQFAKNRGFISAGLDHEETKQTLSLIRMNMNALARRRGFPLKGDGFVKLGGQTIFGWQGSRWKNAYFAKRRILATPDLDQTEHSHNQGGPA